MVIWSQLTPKNHISAMKDRLGSFVDFGQERFTGFIAGRVFYVTHHSGYEWNRRYNNQKNAALGYVTETKYGTEVRFLLFRGAFCLQLFVPLMALIVLYGIMDGVSPLATSLFAIGLIALGALIESFTERSQEGRKILISMLMDPSDPFSYLNNRDKI